ncbi:GNAT family N-acetyltransferase [Riemerella anatipestifer]|uniref:GNAT family N-acetyltransferase n=1 Tax=Riemerella anatipestifer TaxID=34085 RepID=UPI0030BAFE5C
MYRIKRTNSNDLDFQKLVVELDKDLKIRDGEGHSFFAQFNKISLIKYVVVVYENETAVGCGAIKEYEKDTMEIKRMFVSPDFRGKGIASIVLNELEVWAKELGGNRCILETGIKQPEAIRLYQKNDYKIIQNYGQYADIEDSICFEKTISNIDFTNQ